MELETLRRDGVRGQLQDTRRALDGVQGAIRDVALSDAVAAMKEGFQHEITPVLSRVQELEVHTSNPYSNSCLPCTTRVNMLL